MSWFWEPMKPPVRLNHMKKMMLWIVVLALAAAACGSGVGDVNGSQDAGASETTPTLAPDTTIADDSAPASTVADPPGTPRADPVTPPAETGPFMFDSADVFVMESDPIQVSVVVDGSIPTPCDSAGWKVEIVGDEVLIDVYSIPLNDPSVSCIAQIEDVEVTVPLGSFETGAFTVIVNGETVGSFEA